MQRKNQIKKRLIIATKIIVVALLMSCNAKVTRRIDNKPKLKEQKIKPRKIKVMPIIGKSPKFKNIKQQTELRTQVLNLAKKYPQSFYINGQTNSPKVSLTFDDGPNPKTTEKILAILDKYKISATFFCVGGKVEQHPKLAKLIHEKGHRILSHSFSHKDLTTLDSLDLINEIQQTNQEICKITQYPPRWIRPPYGKIDERTLQVLRQQNMGVIYWSLDVFDWLETPKFILNSIQNLTRNDEIILLHEKKQTLKILPQIIKKLQEKNYKIVPLHNLIQTAKK